MTYTDTGMVYIGTNTGYVTLWDPRSTACILHWSAHPQEVDLLWYHNASLVSGRSFKECCLDNLLTGITCLYNWILSLRELKCQFR